MQKELFRAHGTTMRGLMDRHGIDPDHFLDFVHDIDYARIPPAPALDAALAALPGRKLVFTNGSVRHAEQVMDRLGVARHFSGVFDIAASDYLPKPDPAPYAALCARHAIAPTRAAMFEDIARNLVPAHALGMTTVWVRTESAWATEGSDGDHIHHATDDLESWLSALVARRALTAGRPPLG
jgi:putative hydrolase of the HAD superfamily